MAKKYDLKDLGEVYSNLGKETTVVAESTDKATVGDKGAAVGEAPLVDGGITKDCGCEEPKEVEGTDAPGVENPGEPAAVKEEDEEQLDEAHCDEEDKEEDGEHSDEEKEEDGEHAEEDEENALETARGGINNGMAKKSVFDELYSKVISEDFGMEEQDDLDALGIDEAPTDAELGDDEGDDAEAGDEVTVTLDKDMAKSLCDLLKAAMGEDDDDAEDDDAEDGEHHEDGEHLPAEDGSCASHEEDNEGAPKAHTTHVDMGTNNKVGSLGAGHDAFGSQPKVQAANKVAHKPTAGHSDTSGAPQSHTGSVNDGKNNKVGSLGGGQEAFGGKPKVQPKNKEVKAG